jgi:hypothetical protein
LILAWVSVAVAGVCDDLPWTRFRWSDADRGAMFVAVRIDGDRAGWFQLDTGANGTILYEGGPADRGEPLTVEGIPRRRVGAISFAGHEVGPIDLSPTTSMHGTRHSAGTVGANLLDGAVLVLDYANERLAVVSGNAAQAVRASATTVAAENRHHRLFVPVRVNGSPLAEVFFDTGSSQFDLLVDQGDWRVLTGLQDPPADARIVAGSAWGKPSRWIGAPVRELRIGSIDVVDPTVWFHEGQSDDFASQYPWNGHGLFGNRPVWDRVVVADFGPDAAFGFLACDGGGG